MTLHQAKTLALEIMGGKNKLEKNIIAEGWKFDFNERTGSFGVCNYRKKTIYLSAFMVQRSTDESIIDTILHELAHAMCPREKHGWRWRNTFIQLGGNGQRCYNLEDVCENPEELKLAIVKERINRYKFVSVCGTCGYEAPKTKVPTRKTSCGKCSRSFNEKYLLSYIPFRESALAKKLAA